MHMSNRRISQSSAPFGDPSVGFLTLRAGAGALQSSPRARCSAPSLCMLVIYINSTMVTRHVGYGPS
jgi:hypothetical protein